MNRDAVDTDREPVPASPKSRSVAIVLALFTGGLGIHWFYLGRADKGKWYLLFFWTFVPTLLGIRDAVRFYRTDRQQFNEMLGATASVPRSEFPWSDRHWIRLKRFVLSVIGFFFLLVIVIGVRIPEDVDGATPAYPVAYGLTIVFAVLVLVAPFVVSYLISKDQQALREYFDDISSRRWVTVLLFSWFSAGLYPLWYIFARRRRVSSVANFFAAGEFETVSDERRPDAEESSASETAVKTSQKQDEQRSTRDQESMQASIDTGDDHRSAVHDHLEAGDHDGAAASLERAKVAYESALETVRATDSLDETKARKRINSLSRLRTEIRRSRLADEIDTIESTLNGDLAEIGMDELATVQEQLQHASELVEEYGFDILEGRVADLESRLAEVADQQRQRQEGPPSAIPHAPEVTVEYDALREREAIGGGGNADVTKASLPTDDGSVPVAIKTPRLSGTLHTESVERLMEEARTWQQLDDHAHVVSVLGYGSEPLPWIAMEYMDGGPLSERAGDLPIEQAYWTALGITRAVRHAHRHGVAHLDLKPENVLFATAEDAWDVPKVADWGLSKQLLEHSKSVEGLSPHYAAPEQFDGDYGAVDDVTDVYQLGAVLYELFTGRPPFEGEPTRFMRSVLDDELESPSVVDPSLSSTVDDILMPALAKEKTERYDSVIYIRDALEDCLAGRVSDD